MVHARRGWQQRMDVLSERLAEHGLGMRDDSRLCVRYVVSGLGDPGKIAATMKEMDYFWKRTGYRRALRVIERERWPEDLDRDRLSALAKRRALRWLVRAGDEDVLDEAPPTLAPEIERARAAVARSAGTEAAC